MILNLILFRDKRNFIIFEILLFLFIVFAGVLFLRFFVFTFTSAEKMRLEMYNATLHSTIEQYNHLPFLLSQDRLIHTNLVASDPDSLKALNLHLEEFNKELRTTALFILDPQGKAIASSNWNEEQSYISEDYSFRPYYTQAMKGQLGKFYGIGSTTLQPGFFLSSRIENEGKIIGVMVIKISLNDIEKAWSEGPDKIFVADEHGIIFLSVNPNWRLKSMNKLTSPVLETIEKTKQYNSNAMELVENYTCYEFLGIKLFNTSKTQSCLFPRNYRQYITIPEYNWKVASVSSMQEVYISIGVVASVILFIYLFLLMLFKYLRMRVHAQNVLKKNNDYLEREVTSRTRALRKVDQYRLNEMKDRMAAERSLQHIRSELAESNKLAALGQMVTEIAHEQNQPLAAIHALTDNARKMLDLNMYSEVDQNLNYITSVIERMSHNISEMKSFVSRNKVPKGNAANIIKAIYNSLALLNHNLERNCVERRINVSSSSLIVNCDSVGLEQIFSNLIINAVDAMEDQPIKRLDITVREDDKKITVTIKDTGAGISSEVQSRMFDSFFTTKRRGMGLGLAIVCEIVNNSNGTISADNHPDGGTMFTLTWDKLRGQDESTSS
ncbi:ATP-binding protein [Vibrio diazotrophicus]|uniref:ATP-binding protein n=1 Tax=Vibrio diazotrophicus TaxID=685 RepID=UPI00142DEBD7|nr:ATP-binding protein [Vibrio diazotrophicus]NIY92680.1 sensor histidine kinase [Vibrio diazotrophicus]NVK05235.1 sensor histidine kinase [Flavobacteriia bacterium]